MELIEAIARIKDPADEVKVFLVTSENTEGPEKLQKQMEFLLSVKNAAAVAGITLDVKFMARSTTARSSPTPAGASTSAAASTSSNTSVATRSISPPSSSSTARSSPSA